ncbi:MAG: TMEM175 family protein [Coriobacteriales bacterium]|jgi:uncharacterized membrane protein|nr:TMEM175 family protein [Coriobacteriales bacterium]
MPKSRIEAFTDAIIAIVMTILVLELTSPADGSFAALWDLRHQFVIYLISFLTLAIYWNNHHHLLQISHRVNGSVLWWNVLLLLFLSLIPFTTAWVSDHLFTTAPEVTYGAVMLAADLVWWGMVHELVREHGSQSKIAQAVETRKSYISVGLVALGVVLGFFIPLSTLTCCVASLVPWLIPDRRIEQMMRESAAGDKGGHKRD